MAVSFNPPNPISAENEKSVCYLKSSGCRGCDDGCKVAIVLSESLAGCPTSKVTILITHWLQMNVHQLICLANFCAYLKLVVFLLSVSNLLILADVLHIMCSMCSVLFA